MAKVPNSVSLVLSFYTLTYDEIVMHVCYDRCTNCSNELPLDQTSKATGGIEDNLFGLCLLGICFFKDCYRDNGVTYRGAANTTVNGLPCQVYIYMSVHCLLRFWAFLDNASSHQCVALPKHTYWSFLLDHKSCSSELGMSELRANYVQARKTPLY